MPDPSELRPGEGTSEATRILLDAGDEAPSADRLVPPVYEELKRLAHQRLSGERADHTLQTTALVHEAWLKLVDVTRIGERGRAYFFGAAARAMRQVLVDHARRVGAAKRGGDRERVTLDENLGRVDAYAAELLELDRALERLAELHPRQARVVECRHFAGMGVAETAVALDVSERTVKSDWAMAKAWLWRELSGE